MQRPYLHNAESDCATMYERASEAVADQGPCYITCTDSDEYLDRVARDLGYVCGVPRLLALNIAREFRGDYDAPESIITQAPPLTLISKR